ncbi:hypothetical protein P43SY_006903 [Pythium insidiosum]|uniref:Uncharacterized protein n=1 Tax=Pythium insidiosum TaxID=114742 RepID=A0AAD5LZP3_PYTIN|nr:hypothetical protein P43SY_006903 [Pythium insidiosum]
MAKTPSKKAAKTPTKTGAKGKGKGKKRVESYSTYIYKVLRQVHPETGISKRGMSIMNSEYDQSLYEDASTNRMIEAVTLFDEIVNNKFFVSSAMILFLNKKDLFADKIKKVDPKTVEVFKDFPGGIGDYELGVQYFLGKFLEMNRQPEKEIYHHVTCATDSQNVQVVFNACKDIILKQNIKGSGFM